jgi:hypothetical protein
MGSTRSWLLLLIGSVVLVAALAAALTALQSRETSPTLVLALRLVAGAALVVAVACLPPLTLRAFLRVQARIGNARHPAVVAVARHETGVVRGLWAVWAAGALVALPFMVRDVREARESREAETDPFPAAPPSPVDTAPVFTAPVFTPPAGAPRQAIVDAVRARIGSTSEFQIDHLRETAGWAFLRATEIVRLEGEASQETDLTVAALLQRADGSGAWQVRELWTLPTDDREPMAEFQRRLALHAVPARLPAALFPDDIAPATALVR